MDGRGDKQSMKSYIATFHGDIEDLAPLCHRTLEGLLHRINIVYGYGTQVKDLPSTHRAHRWGYDDENDSFYTPDPEDDKIEIWELNTDTNECKVVWGFFGWHWTVPEGLEQGIMPDNDKSLYELAMEN